MMDNAIKNFEKEANTMENNNNTEVTAMTDNTNNNTEADTMMNKTAENNNMEATDMMNETNNNNMEATDMKTGKTEAQVTSRETAMPAVATENMDAVSQLIDEDERAISSESASKIQDMLRMVDQSTLLGMGHVKNILNDKIGRAHV